LRPCRFGHFTCPCRQSLSFHPDFKDTENADSRERITALEEKTNQHDHFFQDELIVLQSLVTQIVEPVSQQLSVEFSELWRGSCDGFNAKEFHRRCDGHANTLTVILDTEGTIFGGFHSGEVGIASVE
jgi:hypothetical protein